MPVCPRSQQSPPEPESDAGRAIDAVLVDIDGTVTLGGRAIDGAADALARIRDLGVRVVFVTNMAHRSAAAIAADLRAQGIAGPTDPVVSPTTVAIRHLQEGALTASWIVGRDAARDLGVERRPDADVLVLGESDADQLEADLGVVLDGVLRGAELWLLGGAGYYHDGTRLRLDVGAYGAALRFATDVEPRVLGKPSAEFFDFARTRLALPKERCLVVGDDPVSDVDAAARLGYAAVQVRTGKFDPVRASAATIASVAELPGYLVGLG